MYSYIELNNGRVCQIYFIAQYKKEVVDEAFEEAKKENKSYDETFIKHKVKVSAIKVYQDKVKKNENNFSLTHWELSRINSEIKKIERKTLKKSLSDYLE